MPFGFLKRKGPAPEAPTVEVAAADARTPRVVEFEGLTDEWRLRGSLTLTGRLLDALNQRESMSVLSVEWAPADGSGPFQPAPGIKLIDPYDLILVIATPETLSPMSDDERRAHQIHKVAYDVAVEAPPYRIVGTIRLHPGSGPEGLLDRGSQMFFALTDPIVTMGDRTIDLGPGTDVILVDRFYMRRIEQVDRETGLAVAPLPELGLGPGEPGGPG